MNSTRLKSLTLKLTVLAIFLSTVVFGQAVNRPQTSTQDSTYSTGAQPLRFSYLGSQGLIFSDGPNPAGAYSTDANRGDQDQPIAFGFIDANYYGNQLTCELTGGNNGLTPGANGIDKNDILLIYEFDKDFEEQQPGRFFSDIDFNGDPFRPSADASADTVIQEFVEGTIGGNEGLKLIGFMEGNQLYEIRSSDQDDDPASKDFGHYRVRPTSRITGSPNHYMAFILRFTDGTTDASPGWNINISPVIQENQGLETSFQFAGADEDKPAKDQVGGRDRFTLCPSDDLNSFEYEFEFEVAKANTNGRFSNSIPIDRLVVDFDGSAGPLQPVVFRDPAGTLLGGVPSDQEKLERRFNESYLADSIPIADTLQRDFNNGFYENVANPIYTWEVVNPIAEAGNVGNDGIGVTNGTGDHITRVKVKLRYPSPGAYRMTYSFQDANLGNSSTTKSVDIVILDPSKINYSYSSNFGTSSPFTICEGVELKVDVTQKAGGTINNPGEYFVNMIPETVEWKDSLAGCADCTYDNSNPGFTVSPNGARLTTKSDLAFTENAIPYKNIVVATVENNDRCIFQDTIDIFVDKRVDALFQNDAINNEFCSDDNAVNGNLLKLKDFLTHSSDSVPDKGGDWTFGSQTLADGVEATITPEEIFNQEGEGSAFLTYSIDGGACPDDDATVEIVIYRKPFSGENNNEPEEICEDGTDTQEIDLFALIAEKSFPFRSPDAGGTWEFEGNEIGEPVIRNGRFLNISAVRDSLGLNDFVPYKKTFDFVYTAPDAVNDVCDVDPATASVTIYSKPEVGRDTTVYVCVSDGFINMDDIAESAGENRGQIGEWLAPAKSETEGSFIAPHTFDASVVTFDDTYIFNYSLEGFVDPVCSPVGDSLTLTLDVQVERYAGRMSKSEDICTTVGDTALYDLLQNNDNTPIYEFGEWYEIQPNGDSLAIGTGKSVRIDFTQYTNDRTIDYIYEVPGNRRVNGITGCADKKTKLTVNVFYSPETGFFNDTIVVCVSDANFVPFDSLLGGAETGGTWTGDLTILSAPYTSNSFIDPSKLVPDGRVYEIKYGFSIGPPCSERDAVVYIRALPGPDAGDDVVIPDPLCSSEGTFDLSQVINENNSFALGTLTPTSPELLHEFIATDPNAVLDPQTGILDLTNLGDIDGEEYEFEFRVFSNTCAADVAKITMTIYRQPNAGDDQSVVICNTAPVFNVFDEVLNENGGVDDYGRWEVEPVIEQAVTVNGLGTTFDPEEVGATTTDFTEGDYIYYIVEAIDDVCPDDTAIISTFTSIQPKIGIPTSSPNEPLPICQSETGFDLFEGVTGEYDRGGRWSLKSYPAFRVGEPKFEKFKDQVNDTSLNDPYLSGEFLETLDAYHFDTVYNSVDGFDIFDAPIFKFSYVLEDTTVNYFPATPDHNFMYECQKDSIDTYVRFVRYYTNEDMTDYLWDESDNYLFRPYEAGQFPVLTIDNQDNAEVVICDSDRDFVLNDYFIGLDDILSVLDLDYDTFYFEGINEVGGIYPTTIFQQDYFVDATKMDIDNNPYSVTINVENECGVFTSEIPLQINLEEEFDAMPIDDIILCGNADPVDPKDPLYIGDYYKDLLDEYPQETGIRALGNSGEVYVAEEIDPSLADPTPAFYKLELFGDRVTCNDLSVEIDVVIERTPFTGNDKESVAVCEGDVVSLASFVNEDVSDNGDFVDPSGVWTGPNSYGPFPYSSATFDTETVSPGSLVEFVYTVDKEGCNPVSTTIELLIIERPHAGSDNTAEVCSNETNLFLLDLLQDADGLPDPSGRFINAPYPGQSGNFQDVTRLSAGTYTYTYVVQGNRPCPDDQAVLTLIVKEPQSSGSDGELDICLGNSVANLFNGLNGTPSDQGYFVPANPGVVDEFYLSGSNKQFFDFNSYFADKGVNFKDTVEFKYVIDGGTCPSDTAYVQVNILPQPKSGTAANIPAVVCNENVTQDLKVFLGSPIVNGAGDYLEGGTWRALTPNRASLTPDGVINPSLLETENIHRFEYRVTTKCGSASSVVVIRVDEIPEMPEDVIDSVCADFQKIDLAVEYPQFVGGTWVDVNNHGGLTGSVFDYLNAQDIPEYNFEYQKPSEFGECADGIGNLTLRYFDKPNAGEDSVVSTIVCKMNGNLVNVDMFDLLTNADAGGTFTSTNPVAQAAISGTVFRVTNNVPNDTYTIEYEVEAGNCPSDVAILRIRVEGQNGNSPTCGDVDNDGILNFEDLDDDNDGMSDITEGLGDDIFGDHDNDLTLNFRDAEWAAIVGSSISQGVVSAYDKDADGVIDAWDLDSDGDNIFDIAEAFPNDYTVFDVNKDGMTDDVNSEGINAVLQGFSPENTDGTDEPDYRDTDSDNDGIFDGLENNGQAWDLVKSDADDLADYRDTDSDDDGILDEIENLGAGFNAWIDTDGDGTPDAKDTDSDGDLIPDADEAYLSGITPEDFDIDGIPNFQDIDSDGDNISDYHEALRTGNAINTDKDILNNNPDENEDFRDIDSDGDGIQDKLESALTMPSFDVNDPTVGAPHDADNDGIADYRELDADADGFVDAFEAGPDLDNPYNSDNDPRPLYDFQQVDADGDGMLDEFEAGIEKVDGVFINIPVNTDLALDNNPDIFYDFQDTDSDGDMIPDAIEGFDVPNFGSLPGVDTDEDGIADYKDLDSDNDSISDENEAGFNPLSPDDSDDDGIYDFRDVDADNDGVLDRIEGEGDCDGDGRPNYKDAGDDCRVEVFVPEGISPNGDGVNDVFLVPDLAVFPNSSVKVYNRWGGLVFEVEQYQQNWGGTDENGELLPDGTYFYVIDLGIGQEAQVGYVYITTNR